MAKPRDVVNQGIANQLAYHKACTEELSKEFEKVNKLPQEILDLNDCVYVDWQSWSETLYLIFQNKETVKQLRMAGVVGLKTEFYGQGSGDETKWRWVNGELVVGETYYKFDVSSADKPPKCRIEAITETKEVTTYKAICEETEEEVK